MVRTKQADKKASGVDGLLRPPQKTSRAAVQHRKAQQLARSEDLQAQERKSRRATTRLERNGFDAATPGAQQTLRAFLGDLDRNNHLLHCAYELAELIAPQHDVDDGRLDEMAELLHAVDFKSRPHREAFFDKLPIARAGCPNAERRRCFWTRYCWLAALATDMDELNLNVEDPPHNSEDSWRSYFWRTKLPNTPLPCSSTAMTMLLKMERANTAARAARA